jgi:hypothetical protein
MAYKNWDEHHFLNKLSVPKSLETFINELPDKYVEGKMDKDLENQICSEWVNFQNRLKKNKSRRGIKAVSISLSIAAACTLFMSVVFISPAFAQMVSNIPYLNLIFENKIKDKPLIEEITDTFNKKKFRHSVVVNVSIKDRKVEVMVIDSKDYYDQVKVPIEDVINKILKKRKEEEYKVMVLNDPLLAQYWKQNVPNDIEDEMNNAEVIVQQVLEKYGYDKGKAGIGLSSNRRINLEHIPNTDRRIDQIKNQILATLKQNQLEKWTLKIYTFDPQLEDRGRLVPLSDTIAKGLLAKKEFKVDSVGSSNQYKDYFYIEIRTTVSKNDPNQKDVVKHIEKTVKEFLTSKDALKMIQDDKYKVVIKSSDKEELREITN